jgi:hypothetical protein
MKHLTGGPRSALPADRLRRHVCRPLTHPTAGWVGIPASGRVLRQVLHPVMGAPPGALETRGLGKAGPEFGRISG